MDTHEYTCIREGPVQQTGTGKPQNPHTHKQHPPLIQTISHLHTLPQPILWPKKKKKPKCSVADSERIEASSSPKLREFSWGYWISPSPLCSVVSLTYRGHSARWIRSAVKRGPKVCRDSLGSGSLACYSLNAAPGSSGAQAGGHRLCHLSISRTEADLTCSEAFDQKGLTVIHTYIHTLMSVAAMQSADQHIRSSLGFSILLKDTSTLWHLRITRRWLCLLSHKTKHWVDNKKHSDLMCKKSEHVNMYVYSERPYSKDGLWAWWGRWCCKGLKPLHIQEGLGLQDGAGGPDELFIWGTTEAITPPASPPHKLKRACRVRWAVTVHSMHF